MERQAVRQKQRSITMTIIIVTLSFILFTGWDALVDFFIQDLLATYNGNLIIALADTLCFSFHGLNLFSLLATNKKFSKQFNYLFKPNMKINIIKIFMRAKAKLTIY
jgi:hypothetical protein